MVNMNEFITDLFSVDLLIQENSHIFVANIFSFYNTLFFMVADAHKQGVLEPFPISDNIQRDIKIEELLRHVLAFLLLNMQGNILYFHKKDMVCSNLFI